MFADCRYRRNTLRKTVDSGWEQLALGIFDTKVLAG
jgi:hypothetical protein